MIFWGHFLFAPIRLRQPTLWTEAPRPFVIYALISSFAFGEQHLARDTLMPVSPPKDTKLGLFWYWGRVCFSERGLNKALKIAPEV